MEGRPNASSASQTTRPFPYLRHAHAAVRLPSHRDLVQSRRSVQAGAESVAAPLVSSDAPNIKMLTDLQPVDTVGDLAVRARLLDSRAKVSVCPPRSAPSWIQSDGLSRSWRRLIGGTLRSLLTAVHEGDRARNSQISSVSFWNHRIAPSRVTLLACRLQSGLSSLN